MAADDRGPSARLIALGAVVGTHGLRGELRVKQHNLDSELLLELGEILLRQAGAVRLVEIAAARAGAKGLLVKLVGVDSIEAAEPLRGAELCVPRSALPPLEDGEFYHVDLEGLAVETPDGGAVGKVEHVHEYPASEVLRVRTDAGVWEVPMREPYFVSVDLEAGRVVVDRLEDLELER
ncbi:MAG TPA: ribosome maturation factor RimM [Polyangiales bacterium]|nr:ribosome maturation factor RimM [Polyangiales bacterium]